MSADPALGKYLPQTAQTVGSTENGFQKIAPLFDKSAAAAARRAEQNVLLENGTKQQAKAIERAANGGSGKILTHSGHELPDGTRGMSHAQTEGKWGHTFYSVGPFLAGVADILHQSADIMDQLDPFYIRSTGSCDTPLTPCAEQALKDSVKEGVLTGPKGSVKEGALTGLKDSVKEEALTGLKDAADP